MTPISPTKYTELLDKFQQLSEETEITRQQITTAYSDLWSEHYRLLCELAELQIEQQRRSTNA